MAYSNLSQLAMLEDEHEKAIREGRSAIALGQVLGRPDIVSHALNNMGTSRAWGDRQQGRVELSQSLEMALAHNFQEHAARTYTNSGCFEINVLEYQAAREQFEAGISYCIDHDLDTWRWYMQGWLAETLLRLGRWTEAADKAGEIVDAENVSPLMRYTSVLALARLRLRRGDPDSNHYWPSSRPSPPSTAKCSASRPTRRSSLSVPGWGSATVPRRCGRSTARNR